MAGGNPRLALALQDAFMDAFSAACVVVGLICLVGAVAASVWLPGREVQVQTPEGDAAGEGGEVAGEQQVLVG
jgi:hypothetical protein